jgi:hypothetical protein
MDYVKTQIPIAGTATAADKCLAIEAVIGQIPNRSGGISVSGDTLTMVAGNNSFSSLSDTTAESNTLSFGDLSVGQKVALQEFPVAT